MGGYSGKLYPPLDPGGGLEARHARPSVGLAFPISLAFAPRRGGRSLYSALNEFVAVLSTPSFVQRTGLFDREVEPSW